MKSKTTYPRDFINTKVLKESLKSLADTLLIEQHEDAIVSHHGISRKKHVSVAERYGFILVSFEGLYSIHVWESDGDIKGWKTKRKRLIKMVETIFKAKCVESWDHTHQGVSVRLNKKVPRSFLQCIINYRDFKCPDCTDGVFCKCGILTKRMALFKYGGE